MLREDIKGTTDVNWKESIHLGRHLFSSVQVSQSVVSDSLTENSLSQFPLFPNYLPLSDGTGCHDLSFLNVEF